MPVTRWTGKNDDSMGPRCFLFKERFQVEIGGRFVDFRDRNMSKFVEICWCLHHWIVLGDELKWSNWARRCRWFAPCRSFFLVFVAVSSDYSSLFHIACEFSATFLPCGEFDASEEIPKKDALEKGTGDLLAKFHVDPKSRIGLLGLLVHLWILHFKA